MRRQDAQVHDAAVGSVFVHHVRLHAQQSRHLAQRIVETRRNLHAALFGAARERQLRQVQHPGVEILGRSVDRERVAPVGGVDAQACGQHAFALDVFRRRLERKLVAGRVEKQLHRRPVGDLQAGRDGVGDGVYVTDIDRQQRIVVGHGRLAAAGRRVALAAAQQGQVFPCAAAQVFEDFAVAGLAAERGVGEVRAQFDEFAPRRVLARDGHGLRGDPLVVVAVDGVGNVDAAVQVVQRAPPGIGLDTRRELRDGVAAVDMEPGEVGMAQVHREVVARNRVVEVDQPRKIEIEVGIAGRDATVELAVAQAAVEPQRVVDIVVEAQLRDVAHDVGVGIAFADHSVDIGREGRVAQQVAAAEQLAQTQVVRLHVAPHAAAPRLERRHPQVAGHLAHAGRGAELHVERRKQPLEASVDVDLPRVAQYADQLVGQLAAADPRSQFVDGFGGGFEPRNVQVETGLPDVGKPPDRSVGDEPRTLADLHAFDLGREIGDHARDLDIDVAEIGMPAAQLGGEIGDVVRRDGRIAQRAVDAHLADEVLVLGPRIARQRDVGNLDVRTACHDRNVLETHAAVGQVEPPGEAVEGEAAALARREGFDGGVDGLPVDGEVVHICRDAVEVHMAEVDAELRVAAVEPFQTEVHILDRRLAQ